MLNLQVTSLLSLDSLLTAGAHLGYRIFVVANEKFIIIYVRASRKSDPLGHKIWLQTGELSCNSEPNSTLFALTLQIVSV